MDAENSFDSSSDFEYLGCFWFFIKKNDLQENMYLIL